MDTSNYSDLNKTWIIDIDGTILKHNGYRTGDDEVLPGVVEFFSNIPKDDKIIIITGRSSEIRERTEKILNENNLRYDHIIFDLPTGERFLFNDTKPSGLKTAYAFNVTRDSGL
tara:strand:- start:17 stop:358 length:342 start_codon:yes stop_codon:yes gene_type:complete